MALNAMLAFVSLLTYLLRWHGREGLARREAAVRFFTDEPKLAERVG